MSCIHINPYDILLLQKKEYGTANCNLIQNQRNETSYQDEQCFFEHSQNRQTHLTKIHKSSYTLPLCSLIGCSAPVIGLTGNSSHSFVVRLKSNTKYSNTRYYLFQNRQNYFFVIKPCAFNNSAQSTAPPAAPLTVL